MQGVGVCDEIGAGCRRCRGPRPRPSHWRTANDVVGGVGAVLLILLVKTGTDVGWLDGDDAHSLACPLDCEYPRQAHQPVLAGGIRGTHRHADLPEDRADVDDHATTCLEPVPANGLRAQQRPSEVDREYAGPALERQGLGRRNGPDARVVDEHVDTAELLTGRVGEVLDLLRVAHISDPAVDAEFTSPKPGDQCVGRIGRMGGCDHRRVSLRQRLDDRGADSAARAGHDRNLVREGHEDVLAKVSEPRATARPAPQEWTCSRPEAAAHLRSTIASVLGKDRGQAPGWLPGSRDDPADRRQRVTIAVVPRQEAPIPWQAELDVAAIWAVPGALPACAIAVARAYARPVARASARLFQTAQPSVVTTCLASTGRNGWLTRASRS
jgi:hypothetical protein